MADTDRAGLDRLREALEKASSAFAEEAERVSRNRDMWRIQCERQAASLTAMREALTDIAVYGCGMLNQPAARNGPEDLWLRQRIAEYERRARTALDKTQPATLTALTSQETRRG